MRWVEFSEAFSFSRVAFAYMCALAVDSFSESRTVKLPSIGLLTVVMVAEPAVSD